MTDSTPLTQSFSFAFRSGCLGLNTGSLLLALLGTVGCDARRFQTTIGGEVSEVSAPQMNNAFTSDGDPSRQTSDSLPSSATGSAAASTTEDGRAPTSLTDSTQTVAVTEPSSTEEPSGELTTRSDGYSDASVTSEPPVAFRDAGEIYDHSTPALALDGGVPLESASSATSEATDTMPPDEPGICNSGDFEPPSLVLGLGYSDRLWGPAISPDGLTLFFGYTTGDEDLYLARLRQDRSSTFEDVTPLTALNTSGNEGTPFVTADGLSLYFYATRPEGPGDRDLWFATRAESEAEFSAPQQVLGVNGVTYDHLPWLSDDELTIYYTTEREEGLGRSDIWQATRPNKSEPFVDHQLVPGINSEHREDAIAFSPNRLTVYFTTDRDTDGHLDIWQATRRSTRQGFSNPQPIDALNSPQEDTNLAMTRDGTRLYFSSGRGRAQRLWVAMRSCP